MRGNVTATECRDYGIRQWRVRLCACVKEKGDFLRASYDTLSHQ